MHVERKKPDWYPLEVVLFFWPGEPLVGYSYDKNACNACIWRNGVNEKDGVAPPLPRYSSELGPAWEVVARCRERGLTLDVPNLLSLSDEDAATAICEAALKAALRGRDHGA
jgi:hypothetical protein